MLQGECLPLLCANELKVLCDFHQRLVSMMLPSCVVFVSVLASALVGAKVTPKPGFQERLKGLNKENKEEVLKLEVFDAATNEVKQLGRWFCMTAGIGTPSEHEAHEMLSQESCNITVHSALDKYSLISMCDALQQAEDNLEICPEKLLRAECLAVYMYTSEFYAGYNQNIRKGRWEPYKVFTALLFSALVKLDRGQPLSNSTVLYRGLDKKFTVDSSGRFYFKQFVSTTMDRDVAEMFGTGTLIVITPNVPIIAAQLQDLSKYPGENEVLISPFEAFELVNKTGNTLYFKSARSQDFLDNPDLECEDTPNPKLEEKEGFKISFKFGSVAASSVSCQPLILAILLLALHLNNY